MWSRFCHKKNIKDTKEFLEDQQQIFIKVKNSNKQIRKIIKNQNINNNNNNFNN